MPLSEKKTRPSRPIRCAVWIVEPMRYRPTDRPTDIASYRGALAHLKRGRKEDQKRKKIEEKQTIDKKKRLRN